VLTRCRHSLSVSVDAFLSAPRARPDALEDVELAVKVRVLVAMGYPKAHIARMLDGTTSPCHSNGSSA
jgi:hypothetical protein